MKGIDERHPAEYVWVPLSNAVVCLNIVYQQPYKKDARLDHVGPIQHFIGKNELSE